MLSRWRILQTSAFGLQLPVSRLTVVAESSGKSFSQEEDEIAAESTRPERDRAALVIDICTDHGDMNVGSAQLSLLLRTST